MTLLCCRLAASCLLVGNYLNSWRNKLGCVSLQKIPKTDYWYKRSATGVDPKPDIWMHDAKRFFITDPKRVNTVGSNSKQFWYIQRLFCNVTLLIAKAIFKLEAWIKQLILSRAIFIGIVKSQYKRDLHDSSSKRQIETIRRGDVQHFTVTFHNVGTVQSDQSALTCVVAGVERGRG